MESLTRRFGITGEACDPVKQSSATPDQTRTATGLLGAVVTVAFAVSFITALRRTCYGRGNGPLAAHATETSTAHAGAGVRCC